MATHAEAEGIERFTDRYRVCCSPVGLDIETDGRASVVMASRP